MGRIQGSDIKTSADLGGDSSKLPTDDQVYVTALGLNKKLKDAIADGDIGGGSGGGGALEWYDDPSQIAPSQEFVNSMLAHKFLGGDTRYKYALIKVPKGYQAGKQVKMTMTWSSPDSSGTVLLQALSTLRRTTANTGDAISSTANQRTTTNSAVTMSGTNQNKPQTVTLDLSDATGNINSVPIAANDLILCRLQSGTMTATSEFNAFLGTAEVSFNG